MNKEQTSQNTNPQGKPNDEILAGEESSDIIDDKVDKIIDPKEDLEFQNNKEAFKNLVKKYLGYRSDWNLEKIFEFLNQLDVTNFNKIFNYFEVQRDRTKNLKMKMDLIDLGSLILEKRNTSITESREKLYAKNMKVTEGRRTQTDDVSWEQKKYILSSSNVELLWDWYWLTLDFWDWKTHIFHIKTANNSLVVMDEFNNPLKCNVELMDMNLVTENIWLWQERVINIKEYRVQVWNLYFVLKFND